VKEPRETTFRLGVCKGSKAQGGGEKRKLFSEKMEKMRRNRNRKLLLETSFFSRKKFSGENLF
jgi:hypothetical protein